METCRKSNAADGTNLKIALLRTDKVKNINWRGKRCSMNADRS
ncbi:hypothetical protein SS05631_a46460 (plasmid) [Sinorhizobium sp. CCBAU 05631]|nr:hypothetical protein SS05631_a46460 [Sinorhizobium sp. CCBAU 05631]